MAASMMNEVAKLSVSLESPRVEQIEFIEAEARMLTNRPERST
jgi:hypothetical protein